MSKQHTPFPWTIYDHSDPLKIAIKGQYSDIEGAHVATVLGHANALAICALPDLVEALEEIAYFDDFLDKEAAALMMARARSALAQVKP